jgi:hypothetical protein
MLHRNPNYKEHHHRVKEVEWQMHSDKHLIAGMRNSNVVPLPSLSKEDYLLYSKVV